jgi:hypothetical protein
MTVKHEHVKELTLHLVDGDETVVFQLPAGERRVSIRLLNIHLDVDGRWVAVVKIGPENSSD